MPDSSQSSSLLTADSLRKLSHELRSPLSTIKGCATVLEEELREISSMLPAMAEFVEIIRLSADQGLSQIPNLIDLLKIETGNLTLSLSPISVNSAVESVVNRHQEQILASGLNLNVELSPDQPVAHAEHGTLVRVIEELLLNALRFTKEGSLTIRTRNTPEAVVIEIEDTGIGIEEDQVDRIFNAFVQINNATGATSQRHSGIGLALSRGLLSLMTGRIQTTSTVGSGSVFTIELPLSMPD